MKNISLDITKAACFLEAGAVRAFEPKVKKAQIALEEGTCPGNDFLGWLHLPSSITPEFIAEVNQAAQVLREKCEANGFDWWSVRVYEASLFLSMLPLHIDNPQKVFGLLLNAKNILKEIEENV